MTTWTITLADASTVSIEADHLTVRQSRPWITALMCI
jgi:hypothetical protein